MPVRTVSMRPETSSIEITGDYPVSPSRLWNAYADPSQLERFWGPPTYPATVVRNDMAVGGHTHYYMTGPEGDTSHGYWSFTEVHAPHSFVVTDGFADASGNPNTDAPEMTMSFRFDATEEGATVTMVTSFASSEDMDKLVGMGMAEGLEAAMGQLDGVLADPDSAAPGTGTQLTVISDTVVRITRVLAGDVRHAWRAHHDADVLRRWQLGPDGWSMPVCEVSSTVGESYRFGWQQDATPDATPDASATAEPAPAFGFTGEVLEAEEPYRAVTTEMMTDGEGTPVPDGPVTRNELSLAPVAEGTLLTLLITTRASRPGT